MNDSHSGPGAARRAQEDSEPSSDSNGQRSLFSRLMGALSPDDPDDDPENPINAGMRHLLPGLANLRRLRVADVSIPKAEIVAVPLEIRRDDLIAVFRESGFSRIPVYAETLDKPVGLLLLKDLILQHGFGQTEGEIVLQPLLRPMLFVPPSMPLTVLLQKMQAERTHMALVIDEYGGVDGLVTIEDLLEQVVGEIDDEHDTEDEGLWQQEAPGQWHIQARAQLDALEEALGIALRREDEGDEDVDTLGGLVFVLLGRVPVRGEVIGHPAGCEIEILEADPRRVKRLRLRRLDLVASPAAPADADEAGTPEPVRQSAEADTEADAKTDTKFAAPVHEKADRDTDQTKEKPADAQAIAPRQGPRAASGPDTASRDTPVEGDGVTAEPNVSADPDAPAKPDVSPLPAAKTPTSAARRAAAG